DHAVAGDGGSAVARNAVTLSTGHSGILIRDNIFFDVTGTMNVNDADDGTVTTIALLNAEAYGSGNLETAPGLVDTTGAASRPYYGGLNLSPAYNPVSAAIGLGLWGRTAGALPSWQAPQFQVNVTGFVPDSVHFRWRNHLGTFKGWRADAGVYEHTPGSTWIVDVNGIAGTDATGWQATGDFALFRNGDANDSLGVADQIEWQTPDTYRWTQQELATLVEAGWDVVGGSHTTSGTMGYFQNTLSSGVLVGLIASGAIQASDFATGAITAAAIAADAIGASEIAADAIGASEIAADAIGSSELATTAVTEIVAEMTDSLRTNSAAILDTVGRVNNIPSGSLGNGANTHQLQMRDSVSSAAISGARLKVTDGGSTTYVDAITGSDGDVDAFLDDGTYTYIAADPGAYTTKTSTFAVSGTGDSTTVSLVALSMPAAAGATMCALYVDTAALFEAGAVDSIQVSATFEGAGGRVGGLLMSQTAALDTTGTGAGSGRAVLTIPRSGEITSDDGVTTFTFRFKDIAVTRRTAPYRYASISGVTVPASASAALTDNLPN
ncbi:MAG TPA: hypothetical protein VM487_14255, partial [Phycisphaerae bacterium]|nr:hypothetical protein [Phycisphaerae bacterium]